jgi:hypothetical protein
MKIKLKFRDLTIGRKKGFVFTLDSLFAVIVATTILSATFFMMSNAQKDYFREMQMNQIANDALIVLDELGVLESHNKSEIKNKLVEVMPTNYGAKLKVFPYECVDAECTGFNRSSTEPPYEIVKGLQMPIDLIEIIDRSSSMADGCPWWAWWCTGGISDAKDAAKLFLEYLYFEKDRGGVVSFGDSDTLDQSLTSSKGAITTAIDAIDAPYWPVQQSAMGDGIDTANQELINNGRADAKWIMILLSDGQSNIGQDPLDTAQDAADNNITIYTIGLGGDADEDTLKQIATMTGGKYYYAPSSDDLEVIYTEVALDIFKLSVEMVSARRSYLTFENNVTKYYNIAEMGVWLI